VLSILHPPIVLGANAAVLYVFVVAFAKRRSDDEGSYSVARPALLAWVLLTIGIGVGGFWAYGTLGWGGYWSWDPIETSAIIPWLFLTALIFFRPAASSRDSDLFVLTLTASSALFTMYVARGANAPSVHSYGMIVEGTYLATLVVIPVLLFAYVSLLKGRTGAVGKSLLRRNPFPASFWSVMGLGLANLVVLLLVLSGGLTALHISRVQLFDDVDFPFLLALVAAELSSTLGRAACGMRPWLTLAIVSAIAAVGLLAGGSLASPTLALVAALLLSSVIGIKWRGPPAAESWASLADRKSVV
jgi:cytochrome c-type biogenesis protein CcmF